MSRASLALAVVALAAALPGTAMAAGPLPPHRDPATVERDFSLAAMVLLFGDAISLLRGGYFDSVSDLLKTIPTEQLPVEFRQPILRFLRLIGDLNANLDSANADLVEAAKQIEAGDNAAAKQRLDSAQSRLSTAQAISKDLRLGATRASDFFGLPVEAVDQELKDAQGRLLSLLDTLDELLSLYVRAEQMIRQADLSGLAMLVRPTPQPAAAPMLGQSRKLPEVVFVLPRVLFLNQNVEYSGAVTSPQGPVQNAEVVVSLGGWSTTAHTDKAGALVGSLQVGSKTPALGRVQVGVTVSPVEPWLSPVQYTSFVFLVNPAGLAMVGLAVAYVVAILLVGVRGGQRAGALAGVAAGGDPGAGFRWVQHPLELAVATAGAISGNRRRVVSSYLRAARVVGERASVQLLPVHTLRQFFRAVRGWVGGGFAELTGLAERSLYRSRDPEEPEARRAEELESQVGREP